MNKNFVRKWILLATIMVVLAVLRTGPSVMAQDPEGAMRLSALEIALWPEYDKPEVLVIFQGRLADDVPLPAQLTLTMPQEAGEPHAVASVDEEGNRLTAAYDLETMEGEIRVTYTSLQDRAFQFEYYLDALQVDGERRQFTFSYRSDLAVEDFALELQQPLDSRNLVLDPPASKTYTGFAELTYHRLLFNDPLKAGQMVEWRVSYDKSSPRLSDEILAIDAEATSGTAEASISGAGTIIAIAAVIVVLAGGGFWLVNSRQLARKRQIKSRSTGSRPAKRKRTRSQPKPATSGSGFCHRCGASLKADALFCPRCGARRK